VVSAAVQSNTNMIIAHHPLIFKGITNIRTDMHHGQLLARLLKADIAVYAAHTNLDIAANGVNDVLVERLQLRQAQPLSVSYTEKLVKLVVFVPQTHVEQVRRAIIQAGAGHIGNYSNCTFQSDGMGTFLPLTGANPFIGEQGKLEVVPEFRLETIMPEKISRRVIKSMCKAHPYEEVAYDIYPLHNVGPVAGLGRIGKLAQAVSFADFIFQVKAALGIGQVSAVGSTTKMISKVAVCGGSGAGLIGKAVFAGADVLVTGDVKYHDAQDALAAGIAIIDAGHFSTEQPVIAHVAEYLKQCSEQEKWAVEIDSDNMSTDVFRVY
jgi:dinuclear metal center YbgI/SA1388 family protein